MARLVHPQTGDAYQVTVSGKTWSSTHGSLRWHGGDDRLQLHVADTQPAAEADAAKFSAELLAQGYVELTDGAVPDGFPPFSLWQRVAAAPEPGKALRALWGTLASKGGPAFEQVLQKVKRVEVTAGGLRVTFANQHALEVGLPYPPVALDEGQVPEATRAMLEQHATWHFDDGHGLPIHLGLDVEPPKGEAALDGTPLQDDDVVWVMQRGHVSSWLLVDEGDTSTLHPYRTDGGPGEPETAPLEAVFFREVLALLG